MRDLILLAIIAPGCLVALRFPFVGAMLWAWISLMNPHRLAYGFMLDGPVALVVALATLVGMLASPEKRSPFIGAPAKWLAVFVVWMCITTALAINPGSSWLTLEKVLKIDLMIFATIMLVRTRREIMCFAWIVAGSLAFWGVKGGIFTLMTAGGGRVYGPSGTYIAENNALAVATIMVLPLLRFLQTTVEKRWQKLAMTGAMLLCGVSILGSYSRGGILAVMAMLTVFWWRGKAKLMTAVLVIAGGLLGLSVMPDEWWERMNPDQNIAEDASAMGRVGAWTLAWNLAQDRWVGGGFAIWRADLFQKYSPDSPLVVSAHSIYFHVIGEHGFIGIFIYLSMWLSAFFSAGWLRKHAKKQQQTAWAAELGGMLQVALVGYAVGGAFLSLAYYDLPYNILALIVVTRWWVQSGAWQHEPAFEPRGSFMKVPLYFGDRWTQVWAARNRVGPATPAASVRATQGVAKVGQKG